MDEVGACNAAVQCRHDELGVHAGRLDNARIKGLWWLFAHQNGDGSWGGSPAAAVASTATSLEALNTAGLRNGPLFGRGYSWLANAPANSVDSLARQILAMTMSGGDTTRQVATLLAARNAFNRWGSYAKYDTSFPDTALALNALLPFASTYSTT